jgi:hypothetical protein
MIAYSSPYSTSFKLNRYILLPISIGLIQIVNYNIFSIAFLLLSFWISITSNNSIAIKKNIIFIFFLVLSFSVGLIYCTQKWPSERSLAVWGQFYVFTFLLLFVKNKSKMLNYLAKIIFILFILDIGTNFLLLIGLKLPWVELSEARHGEAMSRFPGFKGSALYSGVISFLSLAFVLGLKSKNKIKFLFVLFCLFNLILAGNYRTLIIAFLVLILYMFSSIRKKWKYSFLLYIGVIISVVVSTFLTIATNGSNFLRFQLWQKTFNKILINPFWGKGFFSPDVKNIKEASFEILSSTGVTESTILLIAINFGLPLMLLFVYFILKTLHNSCSYSNKYTSEVGVFWGLSLDLFWGTSFENGISLMTLFLSAYLINCKKNSLR